MPARIIRFADVVPTPWRNGGGFTSELFVAPGRGLQPDWRISLARIERSGPFSMFPEYDRTLALIAGRAILAIEEKLFALCRGSVVKFPGNAEVTALIGRARALALNVMTNPCRFRHNLEIVPSGGVVAPALPGEARYLVALTAGTVREDTLSLGDMLCNPKVGTIDVGCVVVRIVSLR